MLDRTWYLDELAPAGPEHLREEYSTFNWLLEPMLERCGFAIRRAEHSANRIYAAYVCVKV